MNLTFHKEDFGIEADWNFFATAHGKGSWDGLAGSVKRQATMESLRKPVDGQILTAENLYEFAKSHFPGLIVEFVASEEIQQLEAEILADRFKSTKTSSTALDCQILI